MRLSTLASDRAYHPLAHRARVTCDGLAMVKCVTADEELGVAVCLALDEHGRAIEAAPGRLRVVRYVGKVKITLPYEVAVEIVP